MADSPAEDSFIKLADGLRELEVVIGEKARPIVAQVRGLIMEALARRGAGDMRGAFELIRRAMERLAAFGGELDAGEGALMKAIAQRFLTALGGGDKGLAKETVGVMRNKAGDPGKIDRDDW